MSDTVQNDLPLDPNAKRASQEMNKDLPAWLQITPEEMSQKLTQERLTVKANSLNGHLGEDAPDWLLYNAEDESVKDLVQADILSEIAAINAKKESRKTKIMNVLGPTEPTPPGKQSM